MGILQPPGTVGLDEGLEHIRKAMSAHYPRFSAQEYQRRYARVREEMAKRDIAALVMYAPDYGVGNQKAITYLSNCISPIPLYFVFPLDAPPTLFMFLYSWLPTGKAMSIVDDVRWALSVYGPIERLKELGVDREKIGLVGVGPLSKSIPHDHYEQLAAAFPNARFEEFTSALHEIMKIPSEEELEWFRKGAHYSDLGYEAMVETAAPGKTDNEVYAAVHHAYLSQPHGTFYFMWIGSTPMSDPVCSYPFGLPSGRTMEKGDILLSEISGAYHGYAGQIMRPVFLGKPTPQFLDLFNLARDVYLEVQTVLKPGNTPRDVLAVSRKFLDRGYSIQCPTIHGWGQRIIPPFADVPGSSVWAADLDVPFQENQLIVIEPSPCTPDGTGGVFLGGLNRVTPQGGELLHKHPVELVVK